MIEINDFPIVSISDDILSKKYGDLFYWKNEVRNIGKNILKSIDKLMEEHGALYITCEDGYTIFPQIYNAEDLEFVKRIITKKPEKEYIINPPNTVYLSYKLIIYNNKAIDGCLYFRAGKKEISRLLSEDLLYLETIIKEKFFSKWKPDYPLYAITLFYLDGMKGFNIGSIEDVRETQLYKTDLDQIKNKINSKPIETKTRKRK